MRCTSLNVLWVLMVGLVSLSATRVQAEFADFRGLWIDRYDYRSGGAAKVQSIVDDAVAWGFTDLIFQVRGQGDAYYNSNFEPKSSYASGWDPLQTVIDAAHAEGLKVHAWMNTMPLWNGTSPPSTSTTIPHPFYHNPSYRVMDLNGQYQSLQSGYVIANPISPDFHTHLNNVAGDIVSNYNIDGLHLDYIRYVGSIDHADLPHDPQSHAMFFAETGLDAANPSNVGAYQQYIRDRITDLVGGIRTTVKTTDASVDLSAAVWRDPDVATNSYLQEYRTWLENDLLDIAMPMQYLHAGTNYLLQPNIQNVMSIQTNALIAPGLGPYRHAQEGDSTDLITQQLQTIYNAGAHGSTMYDAGHLFNGTAYSNQQLANIKNFIDSTIQPDPPPPGGGTIVPLVDFEADEGTFNLGVTYSGSNFGINGGTAERVTDEFYEGGASQRIDIDGDSSGWMLRHVSGGGSPGNNTAITADGWIGFWLMTNDPGLTVQIGLDDPDSADRGRVMPVIADGQWHLYQWDMDDPTDWEPWAFADGLITGPTLTMDSIFFHGQGDATFWLDYVAYNNGGSLTPPPLLPGDLDGDGFVGLSDLDIILSHWNQTVTPGDLSMGDPSGDGFVGLDDLDYVLNPWNTGTPPSSNTNIPEPTSLMLLSLCVVVTTRSMRRDVI